MDLIIRLIIWLIRELLQSPQKTTEYTQPVQSPEESLTLGVGQESTRLRAIRDRTRRQLEQLDDHEEDLKSVVEAVLREGVLAQAARLEQDRERVLRAIATDGAQSALPYAQNYVHEIDRLEVVPEVMEELLRQRRNPRDRAILGDADALAVACYRPILDFAHRHQLPIRSNHPMTLFYPGGTFIDLAFVDYQLAPIGLPESYRAEPWQWPAIAHEIAHDFHASLPDLGRESVERLDLERNETEALRPGEEAFDRLLFRVWLEEIFADLVGALMLGPSYLRAMTTIFREPQAPRQVTVIHVSPEGVLDAHPPRHLRVHLTARFLERLGFGQEAHAWTELWDEEHQRPSELILATRSGYQRLPLAPLLARARDVASRLYDLEFRTLAGHRLQDIPGLDFSKLHVRRAELAAQDLAEGRPAAFDARALIAGATHAALDHRDRLAWIREATRLSIVGVGTGERPATVRAMALGFRRRQGSRAERREQTWRFVEALLLEEILEGRGRPGGPRGYAEASRRFERATSRLLSENDPR